MHKPTVGVDFHFRRFQEGDTSVALQLWDIAGAPPAAAERRGVLRGSEQWLLGGFACVIRCVLLQSEFTVAVSVALRCVA